MDRRTLRRRAVKRVSAFFYNEEEDTPACNPDPTRVNCGEVVENPIQEDHRQICVSDDESVDEDDGIGSYMSLDEALSDWAVHFKVSLVALTALLAILRVHHPSLPKDARTLLRTTTSYTIQDLAGGTYHYFGILKAFEKSLIKIWSRIPDRHVFRLQLNVDGLPLFKSSPVQFWPILGLIHGVVRKPAVIALFCGNSKPNSLTEYVGDLVGELQQLSKGFVFHGKVCYMKVTSVICDAPARAFIKGTKSHTGYSGCGLAEVASQCRTDQSFALMSDEDHHVSMSPLSYVGFSMVTCFPHDYMHLVCFGVVRRLLDLWFAAGPLSCRLSSRQMEQISRKLIGSRQYVPMDFACKPRGLSERLRWKATELRQFLLYTGPVTLHNMLSSSVYNNFMLLSVAIFILASPSLSATFRDFAHQLLVSFVIPFSELYGPEFVTYNVHGLTHLSEDVKHRGHLDLISGFPFEDYLGRMKKMLRTPHHPLAQVIRRISEMDHLVENEALQEKRQLLKEHDHGPIPSCMVDCKVVQFEKLVTDGTIIKVSRDGDCCVKNGNHIAVIENLLQCEGKTYVVFREYQSMQPFFEYPLNSQELGIYLVGNISPQLKVIEMHRNIEKYVRLPHSDKFVAGPLLHTKQ
ncbi:hypothetical protein ACEWY4_001483 [Coilia grayii]|uniref:Uncharacterized protein n=1 Tax=Coilia grayii TaxID=363190 RepID=A0ABD1KT63_9TELE